MRAFGSAGRCLACNTHLVGNRIFRCAPSERDRLTLYELFPGEATQQPGRVRQDQYATGIGCGPGGEEYYPSCALDGRLLVVALRPREKGQPRLCDGDVIPGAELSAAFLISVMPGALSPRTVEIAPLNLRVAEPARGSRTAAGFAEVPGIPAFLSPYGPRKAMLTFAGTNRWLLCEIQGAELRVSEGERWGSPAEGFGSLPAPCGNGSLVAIGGVGGVETPGGQRLTRDIFRLDTRDAMTIHSVGSLGDQSLRRGIGYTRVTEHFMVGFGGRAGAEFYDFFFVVNLRDYRTSPVAVENRPLPCETPAVLARGEMVYIFSEGRRPGQDPLSQAHGISLFDIMVGISDEDVQKAFAAEIGHTQAIARIRELENGPAAATHRRLQTLEEENVQLRAALQRELDSSAVAGQELCEERERSDALQRQLEEEKERVSEIEKQLRKANARSAKLQAAASRLEPDIGKLRADNEALAHQLRVRDEQSAQSAQELARLRAELALSKQHGEDCLRRLAELQCRTTQLEVENAAIPALISRRDELSAELKRFEDTEQDVRGLRWQFEQVCARTSARAGELEARLQALQDENQRLEGEVDSLRKKHSSASFDLSQEKERCGELERRCGELKAEYDELTSRCASMQVGCEELGAERDKLEEDNRRMLKDLAAAAEKLPRLESDLEAAKESKEALGNEVARLRSGLEESKARRLAAERKAAHLSTALLEARDYLARLARARDELGPETRRAQATPLQSSILVPRPPVDSLSQSGVASEAEAASASEFSDRERESVFPESLESVGHLRC